MKTYGVISLFVALVFGLLALLGGGIFGIPSILWWIPAVTGLITALWAFTDSMEGVVSFTVLTLLTGVVAPWLSGSNLSWFNSLQSFVVNLMTKVF